VSVNFATGSDDPSAAFSPERAHGQIHDLGYKRYVGSRRAMGTRWSVIMRHQLATAWKGWWRLKSAVVAAALATVATGVVLFVLRGQTLRMMSGMNGALVKFADGLIPLSIVWYAKIGFLLSLLVGAQVVAGDVQSGAFTFYFARSVRPRDYVLGKLAALGLMLALVMLAGPFLLAAFRLGLSDPDELLASVPILGKALVVGVLGTIIYAVMPLGFSAMVNNPRHAMALWAAYDVVIGGIVAQLGARVSPAIAAIDLPSALESVALALFDVNSRQLERIHISIGTAITSIAIQAAIAIGLVVWRVRRAQQTGVGGGS
jgi:ABC-type transport system involved in multi-copper enzyme maturation permease subunit